MLRAVKSYARHNRAKRRAYMKIYHEANRERLLRKMRERNLLRLYGLSTADLNRMKAKQRGRCAICGRGRRLMVDHDHATDAVRGLLCFVCNTHLGWYDTFGRQVIAYLSRRPVQRKAHG